MCVAKPREIPTVYSNHDPTIRQTIVVSLKLFHVLEFALGHRRQAQITARDRSFGLVDDSQKNTPHPCTVTDATSLSKIETLPRGGTHGVAPWCRTYVQCGIGGTNCCPITDIPSFSSSSGLNGTCSHERTIRPESSGLCSDLAVQRSSAAAPFTNSPHKWRREGAETGRTEPDGESWQKGAGKASDFKRILNVQFAGFEKGD